MAFFSFGYFQNFNIISCINKSSVYVNLCSSSVNSNFAVAGIAASNVSRGRIVIKDCKNYGDIKLVCNGQNRVAAGIFAGRCLYINDTVIIENSANHGIIQSGGGAAGIIAEIRCNPRRVYKIKNCVNTGDIIIDNSCPNPIISNNLIYKNANAIGNVYITIGDPSYFKNCLNLGNVYTRSNSPNQLLSVIAIDSANYRRRQPIISNCLNAGRFHNINNYVFGNQTNINDSTPIIDYNMDTTCLKNNLYDKQMCPNTKSHPLGNINNRIESWLTMDLVGDSQRLKDKLGNEWSYAPNRYPIPLGLENDSTVLLYAAPVYLYSENDTVYNHVDSITYNFNLATTTANNTDTNITMSWFSTTNKVNIFEESARLTELGEDILLGKLGYYEKQVKIIIKDIPSNLDKTKQLQVNIYPNPCYDILNVNINNNYHNKNKIELYNILGCKIKEIQTTSQLTNIDIKTLNIGIYFIKIFDNNNNLIYTDKIIVN